MSRGPGPRTGAPPPEGVDVGYPPESRAGRALAAYVERLSFDPWHALVEHRPLGAVMRARAVAYKRAVIARGAISELEVKPPAAPMG